METRGFESCKTPVGDVTGGPDLIYTDCDYRLTNTRGMTTVDDRRGFTFEEVKVSTKRE